PVRFCSRARLMLVTKSNRARLASSNRAQGRTAVNGSLPVIASSGQGKDAIVDDVELLAHAKAGSSSAFDQIVTIHQEKITRLVHRLLGWQSDVEDVVQDVFVDALSALRKFDGRSAVLTWLTRIAINRCRTHQRRQWLRRHLSLPSKETPGRTAD